MTRLRDCGNPDCRICRWNDEEHQDSGHVVDERLGLAEAFVGMAALVLLFAVLFIILPVMR
jgi:hypothetical protein